MEKEDTAHGQTEVVRLPKNASKSRGPETPGHQAYGCRNPGLGPGTLIANFFPRPPRCSESDAYLQPYPAYLRWSPMLGDKDIDANEFVYHRRVVSGSTPSDYSLFAHM